MTTEQADALKRGDVIYVTRCKEGVDEVVPKTFIQRWDKSDKHAYEVDPRWGLLSPEYMHHTEPEARADIAEMIRAKIERLTAELKKWEG